MKCFNCANIGFVFLFFFQLILVNGGGVSKLFGTKQTQTPAETDLARLREYTHDPASRYNSVYLELNLYVPFEALIKSTSVYLPANDET